MFTVYILKENIILLFCDKSFVHIILNNNNNLQLMDISVSSRCLFILVRVTTQRYSDRWIPFVAHCIFKRHRQNVITVCTIKENIIHQPYVPVQRQTATTTSNCMLFEKSNHSNNAVFVFHHIWSNAQLFWKDYGEWHVPELWEIPIVNRSLCHFCCPVPGAQYLLIFWILLFMSGWILISYLCHDKCVIQCTNCYIAKILLL